MERYNPQKLKEGWSTLKDGEKIYFIHSLANGLWTLEGKIIEQTR